jgi:predicted ArsR family transcriptional regulator
VTPRAAASTAICAAARRRSLRARSPTSSASTAPSRAHTWRNSARLLRRVDDTLEPDVAAAAAAALGRDYGEQIAEELAGDGDLAGDGESAPAKLSPRAALEWMDVSGYGATLASHGDGETVIEVHNCVYKELSAEHPNVVCAFDRSMLCGMLGADSSVHTQTHSLSSGDSFCRHEFRL